MLSLEVGAVTFFSLGKGRFDSSGGVISSLCISRDGSFIILLLGTTATGSALCSSTAGGRLADLAGSRGAGGGGAAALLWSDV